MADYRLILRLLARGLSYRQIEHQARCSHRAIARARRVLTDHNWTEADITALSTTDIDTLFIDGRALITDDYLTPDFDAITRARRYTAKPTMRDLWLDYCAAGADHDKRLYGFDRFRELVDQHITSHDLVAVMTHTPGHTMQVDWAGPTLPITDPVTGATHTLHVFVASLPYSGMIFACAQPNEKMTAWLDSHRQGFDYFGGVAEVIVPDNASTASNRIDRTSRTRDVNETYQEFLAWYNTAAMPTRARRPRDKGSVESAVKIVTAKVIAPLSGATIVDVDEANEKFRVLIDQINDHTPFRRKQYSRREIFLADEKQHLGGLPDTPWQAVTWLTRIVARDFHIEVNRVRYSVPFTHASTRVDVRIIGDRLDILADGQIIATHQTSGHKGGYVTDPDHEPDYFAEYKNPWSRAYFLRQGSKIGPSTVQALENLLDSKAVQAQGFKACRNILDLGKNPINADVLEEACRRLVDDTGRRRAISYTAVKQTMALVVCDQLFVGRLSNEFRPFQRLVSCRKSTADYCECTRAVPLSMARRRPQPGADRLIECGQNLPGPGSDQRRLPGRLHVPVHPAR